MKIIKKLINSKIYNIEKKYNYCEYYQVNDKNNNTLNYYDTKLEAQLCIIKLYIQLFLTTLLFSVFISIIGIIVLLPLISIYTNNIILFFIIIFIVLLIIILIILENLNI